MRFTAPESHRAPPAGYTLVLPPGWVRVPLRSGTDQAIDGILNRTLDGLPRDRVATARHDLRSRLRDLSDAARANCGLDLPTERMHGFTVAASFVVRGLLRLRAQR